MHELQQQYEEEIQTLVRACNRIAELGFVTSHGGNLSYRIEEDIIFITPTKVPKGDISFNDVVIIDSKGKTLFASPGRKPTGETPFHLFILNNRPDISGLVHAHPPNITGLAIAHSDLLQRPLLPEPVIEVGPMLPVEYAVPLSDELAEKFQPVLRKSNAFLMLNHGVLLCSSEGVWRATELLEMMESTAYSAAMAAQTGAVHALSREDVRDLDNVIKTRELPMPGAPGEVDSLVNLYFGS